MKVLIEINCDNAVFKEEPDFQISKIVRLIGDKIYNSMYAYCKKEDCNLDFPIYDINGNKVGELRIEE